MSNPFDPHTTSHDELADIGAKWLRGRGYKHAFSNMTSMYQDEQPDVLGVKNAGDTYLIEVKVSRADFRADAKKWHRQKGRGLGTIRAYLTPPGLLKPCEVPYGWLLLEVHGKKKPIIRIIKGRKRVKSVYHWHDGERNRQSDSMVEKYLHMDEKEYLHFYNEYKSNPDNARRQYASLVGWYQIMFDRAAEAGIDMAVYSNRKHLKQK